MKDIKIIFSIPGRMRINIPFLLHDEKKSYDMTGLLDELCGVISVQPNIRTGNVLVCYDSEIISESEIWHEIEIETNKQNLNTNLGENQITTYSLMPKKFVRTIIHGQKHLTSRLIKTALLTGGIVFAFKFMLRRFFTILIFACPVVIFTIPIATFYYGVKRAKNTRILLKDISAIERLGRTQSVFINDSVFMSALNPYADREYSYKNVNLMQMQRLLRMRQLDDLLNLKISDFVFGIRNNGITDIAIINNENNGFIENIADLLGIEKIYNIQDNVTMLEFFKEHTLIVTSEEIADGINKIQKALTLYVYNNEFLNINNSDINVHCRDINKIPWLVGLTRYCKEIIICCQNSTVAIHSVGILLAALGYIGPLGALSIYGLNMAGQQLYIKNKILSYEKEIEGDS